ncbi:VOC family protein [Gillisia marina]|uniref:VOC family protein n=1 Tax=Gillisia marina TaxID=1167637 RepID=UPI00029A0264|nr:VOC family protein [Gillisia marina]
MISNLWINLPVKNLENSVRFFKEIGFINNSVELDNKESFRLEIGKVVVMLFTESKFREFIHYELSNPKRGSEMLLSVELDSREGVDKIFENVTNAGGTEFAQPKEKDGWLYGAGFLDLDGHRWNLLYMDRDKISTNS